MLKMNPLMKTRTSMLLWMVALLAGCTMELGAQTFTLLHAFTPGTDGSEPLLGTTLSNNTLYGTAFYGGTNGNGTLFSASADGSNFTVLHTFSAYTNSTTFGQRGLNMDGSVPENGVVLVGGALYGTAFFGGTNGWGTVYSVNTNGSNFSVLHTFPAFKNNTNGDGANPAGLLFSGGVLYGAASSGGTNDGTLYSLSTNGTNFTVLHAFSSEHDGTNTDGANPGTDLMLNSGTLYGTALDGGADEYGTIFSVGTNGAGFSVVYTFTGASDGWNPMGGVTVSGDTLYGTAEGAAGWGTVFSVNTIGTNFNLLHTFSSDEAGTNTDGAYPYGDLVLSGGTLYGTTQEGGDGYGTVYSVSTDGMVFTVLYTFTNGFDGSGPVGGLVLSSNMLYGTTLQGGAHGGGTLFSLALPAPSLVITSINFEGSNLVIGATNGVAGGTYTALMSTNVALPLTEWLPVATNVLATNGSFTIAVTNAAAPAPSQHFYILRAQ
jgi:uncharacterized repeat protein (TIGR03803 family)